MKKVLIVDDTKNIRTLLTTCLELRDYEVLTADNGKLALDLLMKEKSNIDLIFLDIRMPEMNGTEVLKYTRDIGIYCPVVIMTAYATVKNAVDCTKLGAVAYLQKPFSPERVNSVLDEIFNSGAVSCNLSKDLMDDKDYIENAKVLIRKGELSEALENLKWAFAKNPYNKEIYLLIGELNELNANEKEAKRFYSIYKLFDSD